MQLGYMRISKADGSQVLHLQRDALLAGGVGFTPLVTTSSYVSAFRERYRRPEIHRIELDADIIQITGRLS